MKNRITLLGHASIRIEGDKTVYVDPWKLPQEQPPADIILVTHSHFDHCSPDDVKKIASKGARIFCPADCLAELGPGAKKILPGEKAQAFGVEIEAVPAYNINKKFHPKDKKGLGFIISMGGERIYIAGDTDLIPEMSSLKDIDVALLPVGGTYTMTAAEAAKAAEAINPRLAIPIHYGDIVGSEKDAQEFKRLCKVETELLL